jgi:hypothetical protein
MTRNTRTSADGFGRGRGLSRAKRPAVRLLVRQEAVTQNTSRTMSQVRSAPARRRVVVTIRWPARNSSRSAAPSFWRTAPLGCSQPGVIPRAAEHCVPNDARSVRTGIQPGVLCVLCVLRGQVVV